MFKKILCFFLTLCSLGLFQAFADNTYTMTTSEAGIAFIKYYEGFRNAIYVDSGGYAIGYGTHCDPADFPGEITENQADELLRSVLSNMEAKINEMAQKKNITFTQNQFDALMSLTYNLGTGWLNPSYNLYNMLCNGIGQFSESEIINTFGKYCHVDGEVLERLAWRRLAEAKIFLYSDYKIGGTQNYEFELIDDPNAPSDILFKADGGGLTICTYSDVCYQDWYYQYLSPLTYAGVIEGYEDKTFRPNGYTTCGEALKTLLLASGYAEQSPTGPHWASGYLDFAEDNGIVPYGDITNLDAPISRALVAQITANALGLSPSSAPSPFADAHDGRTVALYEAGIITGSTNDAGNLVYLPNDSLRRCEVCAVIWRIGQVA